MIQAVMHDADNTLMRWIWPLLASLAGAITALSFQPYRKMRAIDIVMVIFVGTVFAVFMAPWMGELIFGDESPHYRILGAVYYISATSYNVLIPVMIRKVRTLLGDSTENEL